MKKFLKKACVFGVAAAVFGSSLTGVVGKAEEMAESAVEQPAEPEAEQKIVAKQITDRIQLDYDRVYTDENGKNVLYRWKSVKDSEGKWERAYFSGYVQNGTLKKKKIKFNEQTKKYVKKLRKSDITIYNNLAWQDKKGNFYFVTTKTGKDKKVVNTLHQVDKKGKIAKKINLTQWLKITQESNANYTLYLKRIEKDTVVASYQDYKKKGYVFFDRNTGKVKKQILVDKTDDFIQGDVTSSKIIGSDSNGNLKVASLTKEKDLKLPSGNTIKYATVKSYTCGEKIPQEQGQVCKSFGVYKNQVYLLTAAGYYKVNTNKADCEKIASTEDMAFIHREAKAYMEGSEDKEKDYVTVKIMPVSDKKFYVQEGTLYDESWGQYNTLWECNFE